VTVAIAALSSSGCRQIFGLEPPTVATGDAGSDALGGGADGDGAAILQYRKPITIQSSKVGENLSGFPVWIDVTDAELTSHARSDGSDIYFTDDIGTALPYEIQSWAGGHLLAWVLVPTLSVSANTTLYLRYGDAAAPAGPSPRLVFVSAYRAVWHLDDALTSTTIVDSVGSYAGTATALSTTNRVSGQLGSGIHFDGSGTSRIAFMSPLLGNNTHTISAWVTQESTTHISTVLELGSGATDQARFLETVGYTTPNVSVGCFADDLNNTQNIQGSGWRFVAWVYEGGTKRSHVYIDGAEVLNQVMTGTPNTVGTVGYLGYAEEPVFGGSTGMVGTLDEVRIANSALSAGWIATEFANQSSPGTFYTVGAEEPAP
jgi:hypothetical protein